MRIARALVTIGVALTGCSGLARSLSNISSHGGPGEEATAPRVAICYNTMVSTVDVESSSTAGVSLPVPEAAAT